MDANSVAATDQAAKRRFRRMVAGISAGLVLAVALVVAVVSLVSAGGFGDVPPTHPYYAAITDLSARGVIGGYTNGDFGPGDRVMRQQFAKMAVLAGGYSVSEDDVCAFVDVAKSGPDSLYADNYIAVCAAHGITTGTSATTFDPSGSITRLQAVSMAVRMADDLEPGLLAAAPADWEGTASWTGNATHGANAARAERNGLLAGLDLARLDPNGYMSRGEVAQMLHNLLQRLGSTTPWTYGPTTSSSAGEAGSSTTGATAPTTTVASTTSTSTLSTTTTKPPSSVVNLIFIHHSVGENWLNDGLCQALNDRHYHVADIYYGWTGGSDHAYGDSTDTGDWPMWFTDSVMKLVYSELGQMTAPNRITPAPGENTIVMFKSCFPNSDVGSDISDEKAIYNSLLAYFQAHPAKMFVLCTPPPMQSISHPAKTRELCDWLTDRANGWLKGLTTGNVFVFDLYNVLTDPKAHHRLVNGVEVHEVVAGHNTLYYDSDGDDHPNSAGNAKAATEFVPLLDQWYAAFVAGR